MFRIIIFFQMNVSTNAVEADLMSSIKLNKVRNVFHIIMKINTIKSAIMIVAPKGVIQD